jgi:hypothetical protein
MSKFKFIFTASLLMLASFALAGKKKDPWKYAGEDQGVRFFFKADHAGAKSPIIVKVENTLPYPVDVSFRVKDLDWKRAFSRQLDANQADSLAYLPSEDVVSYPYVDRVFLAAGPEAEERLTFSDR